MFITENFDSKKDNSYAASDPESFVHSLITALSLAERQALAKMLKQWFVTDLQQISAFVDQRLATMELMDRLSRDPRVHESALHEMIVRSLWLFGLEFEDSEFCSNATLRTVVRRLFGRTGARLVNARQRPDIVIVPGGSRYCFATLQLSPPPGCAFVTRPAMIVLELKRGGSRLTRQDMAQLEGYAHELAEASPFYNAGFIHAWVVGDDIAAGLPIDRLLCNDDRCYARIRATTFSALSETARRQFPGAFSAIRSRYLSMSMEDLIVRAAK